MPFPLPVLDTAPPDVSGVADRLGETMQAIRQAYLRRDRHPWVVAYSGGKDSTLLLQLVWEVVESLPESDRRRQIVLVGNDTLVESPLVIGHLRGSLETIRRVARKRSLPINVRITKPHIDQTFWVNVIGRGYIPPTRNFRWCTDRMKIRPTSQLLEQLVRANKKAVLLVGTRKAESETRRRNMKRHGASARRMNRHSSVEGCWMFAPLADLSDEEVWLILMQRNPPWGGTHQDLITLYRNAGGGECPLVLTKADAPSCGTTSPRFGCWTCTVVTKDRSLRGLIDSGHRDASAMERLFEFREWLVELREDDRNRDRTRRDGSVKRRSDGSYVMGPFTLEVRRQIFHRLLELQEEVGATLIQSGEIELIEDIWGRDRVHAECRQALREAFAIPA